MAEQSKLDLIIGLNVEGSESAAQRVARLQNAIEKLELAAKQNQNFRNLIPKFQDLIRNTNSAAQGVSKVSEQAKILAPAMKEIGEAIAKTGMGQDFLKKFGMDPDSLAKAGKSASGFTKFIENFAAAASAAGQQNARAVTASAEAETNLRRARAIQYKEEKTLAKEAAEAKRVADQQAVASARAAAAERVQLARTVATTESKALVPVTEARAAIPASARSAARRPTTTNLGTATSSAAGVIQREATAAQSAATAMRELANAKRLVTAGEQNVAKATGSVIQQLMREIQTAPRAAASLHQMLRRNEAQFNQAYAQRAAGTMGVFGRAIQATTGAIRNQGDALLGQIKQVAVLATTFSVLQGVAGRITEGFHHLTGGIIGFNQMIERTTVGFEVLFRNQAKNVEIQRQFGDTAKEIDYVAMGYNNANEAAKGMVETIRQFANVTPFRFAELAEGTLRLRAFGFGMDEILYKSKETKSGFDGAVVAIGDAVASLGGGAERFQRISYALGQMKQAGRVYQNDMMQLANAGIGGYQYLADKLRQEITTGNTGRREDVKKGQLQLYDDLTKNAIETVRRLTTNGQISGEAAARAIIEGLKRDFGGGMEEFSKTFVGAWSTLADTSQSLVATAFEPFYKRLTTELYDLGQFFQTPEAAALAQSFQPFIQRMTDQIFNFGRTAAKIFMLIVNDITGAFGKVKDGVGKFKVNAVEAFNTLRDGIGVISSLLQNDLTRSLITTSTAVAGLFGFVRANPVLSGILAIIAVLGLFKRAYDSNVAGFRGVIDGLVASFLPLVATIRDNLIPAVLDFVGAFGSTALIVILETFKTLSIVLETVAKLFAAIAIALRPLAPLLGVIVTMIAGRMVWGLAARGIQNVTTSLIGAITKMKELGTQGKTTSSTLSKMTFGVMGGSKTGRGKKSGGFGVGDAANVGMALGVGADILGFPDVGGILFQISMLASGLKILSSSLPASVGKHITGIGTAMRTFLAPALSAISGAMGTLASYLTAPVIIGLTLAASVIAGIIALLFNFGKGTSVPKPGSPAYSYLTGGATGQGPGYKVGATDTEANKAAQEQARLDRENAEKRKRQNAAENAQRLRDIAGQARRQAAADQMHAMAQEVAHQKENAAAEAQAKKDYDLLVQRQNREARLAEAKQKAQEKYNRLLQIAERTLQTATSTFEEIATKVLSDLLNPESRVNPYTGQEELGLTLEKQLEIEQELGFTEFQNALGRNRSFAEYKDILNAIKPLTEDETANGVINLKMVKERLKIETARRKELENIRKIQEAEYDLGLATLQQYDESIDPLQRAVQLRQAQTKYSKDIKDLQFGALEEIVAQANDSAAWSQATAATQQRLKDLQDGQQLILDEMKKMFEDYNNDVADIMSNPTLSAEQKKDKITERLAKLKEDLASNFGVTEALINDKVLELDAQMQSVVDVLNLGDKIDVSWGETVGVKLGDAYDSIIAVMDRKLKRMVDLQALIAGATNPGTGGGGGGGGGDTGGGGGGSTGPTLAEVIANRTGNLTARLGKAGATFWQKFAGDNTAEKKQAAATWIANIQRRISENLGAAETIESARNIADKISSSLSSKGLAKGGVANARSPYLVGEAGPELFIPDQRGLVLNSNVSSKLLDMMGRSGMNCGSIVNINVNNPVIRNDGDIRKLAQEISRAQASRFRTEGGRLY